MTADDKLDRIETRINKSIKIISARREAAELEAKACSAFILELQMIKDFVSKVKTEN